MKEKIEAKSEPTIKGIFVNSHLNKVRRDLGEDGVKKMEKMLGRPVRFRNSEDVPIAYEIEVIETALEILSGGTIPSENLSFEAGRFHFKNFSNTPLGRMLFSVFKDQEMVLLKSKYVAQYVFKGVSFNSKKMAEGRIMVSMEGGQYPLEHFRGFFSEWMSYAGYIPRVQADKAGPETYIYILDWSVKE